MENKTEDYELTTHQVKFLQDTIQKIAQLSVLIPVKDLETWMRQMKTYESGSLDAILPHQYTIEEIAEMKKNFRFLLGVSEHVVPITKFVKDFIEKEQKAQDRKLKSNLKLG